LTNSKLRSFDPVDLLSRSINSLRFIDQISEMRRAARIAVATGSMSREERETLINRMTETFLDLQAFSKAIDVLAGV
jgi:hypothetical protein